MLLLFLISAFYDSGKVLQFFEIHIDSPAYSVYFYFIMYYAHKL